MAFRVLGNRTQAEDAAQQTWLQLIKYWDRVSALPWEETEGYVVTVSKNCALDILRSRRRTVAFPENWDPPAPEDHQDEYDYLVSLIRALPEGYRRVLELKLVEEETNREIARRLEPYPFPEQEHRLWVADQEINIGGVALDMGLVNGALEVSAHMTAELSSQAKQVTGLENPNSVAQLKQWIQENAGVEVESLDKQTGG